MVVSSVETYWPRYFYTHGRISCKYKRTKRGENNSRKFLNSPRISAVVSSGRPRHSLQVIRSFSPSQRTEERSELSAILNFHRRNWPPYLRPRFSSLICIDSIRETRLRPVVCSVRSSGDRVADKSPPRAVRCRHTHWNTLINPHGVSYPPRWLACSLLKMLCCSAQRNRYTERASRRLLALKRCVNQSFASTNHGG